MTLINLEVASESSTIVMFVVDENWRIPKMKPHSTGEN